MWHPNPTQPALRPQPEPYPNPKPNPKQVMWHGSGHTMPPLANLKAVVQFFERSQAGSGYDRKFFEESTRRFR
jgi:hypothetical protein